MKADELKTCLKEYSKEDLIKLYSRTYRMVPKTKREDILDPLLREGKTAPDKTKPVEKPLNYDELDDEVTTFVFEANQGLYAHRNRNISEKKRRNWRFAVKRYYTQLNEVPMDHEYYELSIRRLFELFEVLSKGCGYILFTSEDPFETSGIHQAVFADTLAKKVYESGHPVPAKIEKLISDLASCYLSYIALNEELLNRILYYARRDDQRRQLIEIADSLYRQETKKGTPKDYTARYYSDKYRNELCEFITKIYLLLFEEKEAEKYFWSHYLEREKEVTLYAFLRIVDQLEMYDFWIQMYNKAIKIRKIVPREALKERYQEITNLLQEAE